MTLFGNMIQRIINPSKSNSIFIFGARGTGKSTFIKGQFLEGSDPAHIITIDMLLPTTEDLFAREPERLKAVVLAHKELRPLEWVFIDEVQKVPRLLRQKTQKRFGESSRRSGLRLLALPLLRARTRGAIRSLSGSSLGNPS